METRVAQKIVDTIANDFNALGYGTYSTPLVVSNVKNMPQVRDAPAEERERLKDRLDSMGAFTLFPSNTSYITLDCFNEVKDNIRWNIYHEMLHQHLFRTFSVANIDLRCMNIDDGAAMPDDSQEAFYGLSDLLQNHFQDFIVDRELYQRYGLHHEEDISLLEKDFNRWTNGPEIYPPRPFVTDEGVARCLEVSFWLLEAVERYNFAVFSKESLFQEQYRNFAPSLFQEMERVFSGTDINSNPGTLLNCLEALCAFAAMRIDFVDNIEGFRCVCFKRFIRKRIDDTIRRFAKRS